MRQLDAVASRFLRNLTDEAPLLTKDDTDEYVFLDVDDTIIRCTVTQSRVPDTVTPECVASTRFWQR